MQKMLSNKNNRFKRIFTFTILSLILLVIGLVFSQSILQNYEIKNTIPEIEPKFHKTIVSTFKPTDNMDYPYVRIGGVPIGISVNANGVIVIGFAEVNAESGKVNPAKDSGLQVGDVILKIDGEDVNSVYRVRQLVKENQSGQVEITYFRNGETKVVSVNPAKDRLMGENRLGIMLKEDVGGIGTLTFVTEDKRFAALGHHILDPESGLDDELTDGNIYATSVTDVVKGENGKAGGLVANVNRTSKPLGDIEKNTDIGIYGDYLQEYNGERYKIASASDAKIGAAKVFTTINGTEPKFYDIEVVKVVQQSEPAEKGLVILVTDKELIEKTGGIVQGMSGSPIVQDGKLIGAVTHVFIQDSVRGYAVHSRFMYDYAMNRK